MQEEITIEKAEKLFSEGETRLAGSTAGMLLERSVDKLRAFHRISLSDDLGTRKLLDRLYDAFIISRGENRELQNLVSIRNKCVHGDPITRNEVQILIKKTREFSRWVDSQSSNASAFSEMHKRNPSSTLREMYTVTCAECGVKAEIPFLPANDRPVYCSLCILDNQYDIRRGDVVIGVIVRIDQDEILVDIGLKDEGILSTRELPATGDWSFDRLHLNDKLLVYVVRPDTPDGHALLSLKQANAPLKDKNKAPRSSSQPHLIPPTSTTPPRQPKPSTRQGISASQTRQEWAKSQREKLNSRVRVNGILTSTNPSSFSTPYPELSTPFSPYSPPPFPYSYQNPYSPSLSPVAPVPPRQQGTPAVVIVLLVLLAIVGLIVGLAALGMLCVFL